MASEAQDRAMKKFLEDKKQIKIYLKTDILDKFNKQLSEDKLSKQEVLETAVYQYINGELRVNKNN